MPVNKTTREQIIYASTRLFRRRGYYRTSMKDLTAELKLTKGAFYHHFKDKADLMRACLEATRELAERRVFSVVANQEVAFSERVTLMASGIRRLFSYQDGGCFVANTALETAQVEDTFLEEIRTFMEQWRTALERMLEDAGYPEKEWKERSGMLVADLEGSIVLMQVYRDETYLEKAISRMEKTFQRL